MSKVVAAVSDMIFQSKIVSTAQAVGLQVNIVTSLESFRQTIGKTTPECVLVDLEQDEQMVMEVLKLAHAQSPKPTVIGYCPHVRQNVLDLAVRAGFDKVMPRSAFATNLATILGEFVD